MTRHDRIHGLRPRHWGAQTLCRNGVKRWSEVGCSSTCGCRRQARRESERLGLARLEEVAAMLLHLMGGASPVALCIKLDLDLTRQ